MTASVVAFAARWAARRRTTYTTASISLSRRTPAASARPVDHGLGTQFRQHRTHLARRGRPEFAAFHDPFALVGALGVSADSGRDREDASAGPGRGVDSR